MTKERKRRMRQHFLDMLENLKDGEIHVVTIGDEVGDDDYGNKI